MAQLRQDYTDFSARGAEVIAIGPEDPPSFAQWWQEHDMPFVGAGDPDHRVADLYGQEVNLVKLGRMPAQFVIDQDGRIRYQHHSNAMWDIPANEEILRLLDQLNLQQGKS
jgi:peroxiredoxin